MSDQSEARRALEPMRSQLLSVAEPDSELRDHTIARLKYVLKRTPRWPRRTLVLAIAAVSLAVSAAAALLVNERRASAPEASRKNEVLRVVPRGSVLVAGVNDSSNFRLQAPTSLPAGGVLTTTDDSSVAIVTPSGVEIAVSRDSKLELGKLADAAHGSLKLLRGVVNCHVPPRSAGQSFAVVTEDAIVQVHGTAFTVEAGDVEHGIRTCVFVKEGVVTVQRPGGAIETLRPGESSGCELDGAAPPSEDSPDAAPTASSPPPARGGAAKRSSLAEESALLRAALLAEQAADVPKAQRALDELLKRYPHSPLAAEAARVRDRLRAH